MRRARFLAPWKDDGRGREALYHCVSRVVDRRRVFGRAEKEQFVKFLRLYEGFCGVRVRSYCVMSNHFHVLVEVPPRPAEVLGDAEFLERLGMIYSELKVSEVRCQLAMRREAGDDAGAEAFKEEKYLYRLWDLSEFMKVLKQRFTQWFNKRHGRKGTLWEDRFKSVLVEDGYTARVMSAYIDLNPVRAGMVADPARYRWSSYGAAVAGDLRARAGIERTMTPYGEQVGSVAGRLGWRQVAGMYRVMLFEDGEDGEDGEQRHAAGGGTEQGEEIVRVGVSKEAMERERARGGRMGRAEMLRHRLRQAVDGMVWGSREFVDGVHGSCRELFGAKRRDGARRIRGTQGTGVWTMRDLGPPQTGPGGT
jgi:REP element-mobilizing transposase RayT